MKEDSNVISGQQRTNTDCTSAQSVQCLTLPAFFINLQRAVIGPSATLTHMNRQISFTPKKKSESSQLQLLLALEGLNYRLVQAYMLGFFFFFFFFFILNFFFFFFFFFL